MGRLTSKAPIGDALSVIDLPSATTTGGLPIMEALSRRRSEREFLPDPLPYQTLSNLMWAAFGINRRKSKSRTAPSAINCQEIDVYVAMPRGAYCYEPHSHSLQLVAAEDLRPATGHQASVGQAPLDLLYIADHTRMKLVPKFRRESYASASAGAIAQNVYLFCASDGLSTVLRAWIPEKVLSSALGLRANQQVLFAQSVGFPSPSA